MQRQKQTLELQSSPGDPDFYRRRKMQLKPPVLKAASEKWIADIRCHLSTAHTAMLKNHLFSVDGNLCNLNNINTAGFLLIQQQQTFHMPVSHTGCQILLRDAVSGNLSYHLPALGLEHLHCPPAEFLLSQQLVSSQESSSSACL